MIVNAVLLMAVFFGCRIIYGTSMVRFLFQCDSWYVHTHPTRANSRLQSLEFATAMYDHRDRVPLALQGTFSCLTNSFASSPSLSLCVFLQLPTASVTSLSTVSTTSGSSRCAKAWLVGSRGRGNPKPTVTLKLTRLDIHLAQFRTRCSRLLTSSSRTGQTSIKLADWRVERVRKEKVSKSLSRIRKYE
jgi:hypothetical protein